MSFIKYYSTNKWRAAFLSHSEVDVDKQLVCEPCGPHVAGGYDPDTQQVSIN